MNNVRRIKLGIQSTPNPLSDDFQRYALRIGKQSRISRRLKQFLACRFGFHLPISSAQFGMKRILGYFLDDTIRPLFLIVTFFLLLMGAV